MSAIKAIQILDQIAGLFMELRKELTSMGTTTSSMDTLASDFLKTQIQALSIPSTVVAAPAVAAAAAPAPKTKTASKPKAKETSVANILTEAQLQEMLAAGVKAQAHTKKLAADWFGASKFNIPETQHQAARDQWVAFGKSNGAVRTTRGGNDTWPTSPTASVQSETSTQAPVAAAAAAAASSTPIPAAPPAAPAAAAQLLTTGRLNQLKSYGIFADSELGELVSWFKAWKIPADKFAEAFLQWREWAPANGVSNKPRDEDGDTLIGDDGEDMELNLE
jgi:hypothetical protein